MSKPKMLFKAEGFTGRFSVELVKQQWDRDYQYVALPGLGRTERMIATSESIPVTVTITERKVKTRRKTISELPKDFGQLQQSKELTAFERAFESKAKIMVGKKGRKA